MKKISTKGIRDTVKMSIGTVASGSFIYHTFDRGLDFHLIYLLIGVVMILVTVGTVSAAKYRENAWAFVMTVLVFTPVNISLIGVIREMVGFLGCLSLPDALCTIITYMFILCLLLMMLSLEEIAIGILVRLIWRRQKKMI